MLKELKPAFLMMVVMTVLTGLVYPGIVTVLSQALFPDQANGSLITVNGQVVGSRLIGQNFAKPEYFQPRPSRSAAVGATPRPSRPPRTPPSWRIRGVTTASPSRASVRPFGRLKTAARTLSTSIR